MVCQGVQGLVYGYVPLGKNIILCWVNTQNICIATSKMTSPSTVNFAKAVSTMQNTTQHN